MAATGRKGSPKPAAGTDAANDADAGFAPGLARRIAPPRFIAFALLLIGASALCSVWLGLRQALLAGFDIAALVFLASLVPLFTESDNARSMRRRSAANDANRAVLLGVTGAVTIVVLVTIALELGGGQRPRPIEILLVLATLLLAWLFSNMVYALHYAHMFYRRDPGSGKDAGGIDFPDTAEPDYWDFLYFAYTLGMTFQTSDVAIGVRGIRRVVIFHCLAAFIFNLGVIAFSINVLGS